MREYEHRLKKHMHFQFNLIGFAFLGVWLNQSCGFGSWTVWTGLILGILSGVNGFRSSLHAMKLMAKDKKTQGPPPVSFNDHI